MLPYEEQALIYNYFVDHNMYDVYLDHICLFWHQNLKDLLKDCAYSLCSVQIMLVDCAIESYFGSNFHSQFALNGATCH